MADQSNPPTTSSPIRAEIAGNRLELIDGGVDRFNMLLELIGGAEKSIRMLMYMFTPDKDGDIVRHALTEAASRGVEVKLLVDGFGSAATPQFFDELAQGRRRALRLQPELGTALSPPQPPETDRRRRQNGADRRCQHRRDLSRGSRIEALA